MTTAASVSSLGETALQKEQQTFGELFPRLRDAFLNRIFDLRPDRAARRLRYLIFLLLLTGFLITLTNENYALRLWARYTQDIFLYLLNPLYAANYQGNPFLNFISFAWQAFTDPHSLQYLPIFLAAFFIALQSAAIYLADIFELEEVRVARSFIWEVALSGSDEIIRISQGEISEQHRQSPNYLIGGPGKVVVDLDSVAVFEKPDGTPHIIGPTGKERGGRATLEGFERFRQAIDLRDHFIELRDQDDKSPSVKSRSLDGIPITATDVRLMFSVHRDGKRSDIERPYPFSEKAIERLVYKATSKVTPNLSTPSTFEFSWINNMIGLIRTKLIRFMSERNLTVYLASTGIPEFEKAKQREEAIAKQGSLLGSPLDDSHQGEEIIPPPKFTPRHEITNLFTQFAKEFTESARDRGVELHWIGVGTWKTPAEIVPEKHLEAWKLSRENLRKGSDEAISKLEKETIALNMATLIQDVPVAAHQKITGTETNHARAVRRLIIEYRQQLIEAAEFIHAKGEAVPFRIVQAIEYISEILGFKDWHWIGKVKPDNGNSFSSTPKPDAARSKQPENDLYSSLLRLVGGDPATADRLIEFERGQFPDETRAELIERAIERLTRDRQ